MVLFLLAPYLNGQELQFCFASHLLTHPKFLRLKFYASEQESFSTQHSGVRCRRFWLKFFRIGNESPGLMGSRWAQKCISPFYPQTLLRFLRVLNIHGPTLHKASVDLMVCISPKHTQTSCKLFPAYLGPSRRACQVTEGYLIMPYLFPMIKVFIYTCAEQREIWVFVPLPSSKTPQLPAGSLHLATVFAGAPDRRADPQPAGCSGFEN